MRKAVPALLAGVLALAIPASVAFAQAVEEPMTVTLQGEAGTLATATGGGITVLADGVECDTVAIAATDTTATLAVGAAGQPAACLETGAALTFRNAEGQTLVETGELVSGGTLVVTNLAPEPPSSGTPPPSGELPFDPAPEGPGLTLGIWSGGTVDDAASALPNLVSVWVTIGGEFTGYIAGAPEFVNAGFMAEFQGGAIAPETPVLVVVG